MQNAISRIVVTSQLEAYFAKQKHQAYDFFENWSTRFLSLDNVRPYAACYSRDFWSIWMLKTGNSYSSLNLWKSVAT